MRALRRRDAAQASGSGSLGAPLRYLPGKTGTRSALTLVSTLSATLGLFFPARCRVCDRLLEGISRVPVCPQCWTHLTPLPDEGLCGICGLPGSPELSVFHCPACIEHSPRFTMARSFGAYGGALREIVHLLKYQGMTPLAQPLGDRMAAAAARPGWRDEFAQSQAVVAVPLDSARRNGRGYNQAELLARVVARRMHLPLLPRRAFRRVRATTTQTGLTRP